jgi:peptidoglycan/LPS O-acetylase OafA/YrhL
MNFKFEVKDISTYRSELMGWAILWIMMLHFTFTQIKPLGFVAQYGFAGVEIFMLVSGFGLFFSLEKKQA